MDAKEDQVENIGCYAWFVQVGKSVNERWARARNSLRKRFHREHMQSDSWANETGTPDMIFKLKHVGSANYRQRIVLGLEDTGRISRETNETPVVDQYVSIEDRDSTLIMPDSPLVRGYISDICTQAQMICATEHDLSTTCDDTEELSVYKVDSMTSSIISNIAEAVVNFSLKEIVASQHIEHSSLAEPTKVDEYAKDNLRMVTHREGEIAPICLH